ncbi:DoxX family protein, partial [Dietzia sp. E1]|uniref:DoxX family protein n=1 Tax=Dietzia sp. E1 TaxID=328361 RepID=UPI001F5124C3
MTTSTATRPEAVDSRLLPVPATVRDAGLLITRVILGVVLIAHGWEKFAINGIEGTGAFFDSVGIPGATAAAAAAVGAIELVGGILLILGLLTPPGRRPRRRRHDRRVLHRPRRLRRLRLQQRLGARRRGRTRCRGLRSGRPRPLQRRRGPRRPARGPRLTRPGAAPDRAP